MAASLWLWLPPPSLRCCSSCPPLCKKHDSPAAAKASLLLCTSSSSSVVTQQQDEAPDSALLSYQDDPNFRGCKGCGRDQVERGCNGEGRIQGGIAAVPGFGWWPIKAYRPCPGFVSSGGRYRRQGQSMDDVASGRGKKVSSAKNNKSDK